MICVFMPGSQDGQMALQPKLILPYIFTLMLVYKSCYFPFMVDNKVLLK